MCFCRPGFRREFGGLAHGCVGETGQDVGQIFAHRDGDPAAAFDNGEDSGYARPGLRAADMDPILSSDGDGVFIVPLLLKY